jgi:hypothetical protein
MKHFVLMMLTLLSTGVAFGANKGTLTCEWEVYPVSARGRAVRSEPFTIDITQPFFSTFTNPALGRDINLQYHPGFTKKGDVDIFIVTMGYDSANGGADAPAINGRDYTFKIGRQGSDLIGGFLNCRAAIQ